MQNISFDFCFKYYYVIITRTVSIVLQNHTFYSKLKCIANELIGIFKNIIELKIYKYTFKLRKHSLLKYHTICSNNDFYNK